jgi:hypothetical protein
VALKEACGGSTDITGITESYNVSVSVYFVSESQIKQPQAIIISQAVTEKKSLLFRD